MSNLKKILMLNMVQVILVTAAAQADCISDCRAIIQKSDKIISDLHDEINTRKQLESDQANRIAAQDSTITEKDAELVSIWRNPFFDIALGVILGGAGAAYLSRK